MRTIGTTRSCFEQLADPDRLESALEDTVRGKRRRSDVAWLLFRRDQVLGSIHRQLAGGTWRPGGFDLIYIRDPKPRVIARAPVEDRVVHTALASVMEPSFTRSLTDDVFACRPGFGTHRARLRLLELLQRHRYSVHLDVRSYFPSIDLEILRGLLARRIRDRRFLGVVDLVLDSGASLHDTPGFRRHARMDPDWPLPGGGLPIGALTSQLFAAHVYLNALDHFVKRVLKVPGYLRYVDDLYLFGRGRAEVRSARDAVAEFLWTERRLTLKSPEARVRSCMGHLDGLGKRITREGIEPLRRSWVRLRSAAAREIHRRGGERRPDIRRLVASAVGHYLLE